jgi:hypothetical protein
MALRLATQQGKDLSSKSTTPWDAYQPDRMFVQPGSSHGRVFISVWTRPM